MRKPQLIVAIDTNDSDEILYLLHNLPIMVSWIKLGYSAINTFGLSEIISKASFLDYNIFADLKFYDIPSTVSRDVRTLTQSGVQMLNIHATGGIDMMRAAKESSLETASKFNLRPPILLGVTILTSQLATTDKVIRLAEKAKDAGLDGVVASPFEVQSIRKSCGDSFLVATPGIRPRGINSNDQQRYMTPKEAVQVGSNFIIVGRPIINAIDSIEATELILEEIDYVF